MATRFGKCLMYAKFNVCFLSLLQTGSLFKKSSSTKHRGG